MNDNTKIGVGLCESFQDSVDSFIPYNQIGEAEFDVILNKIGSFLYLINNKNINPTNLFLTILSDPNMQKLSMELMSTSTLMPILKGILIRYPNLVKSKMLKTKAGQINKTLKKKNIHVN
jgi:hypothetical protein